MLNMPRLTWMSTAWHRMNILRIPQFSRRTILAATDRLGGWGNTEIDRFLPEYGLEDTVRGGSRADRGNALGRYLLASPDATTEDGENLTDAIVFSIVEDLIQTLQAGYEREFNVEVFRERYAAIHRGLERDGFTVEDGVLRRTLPGAITFHKPMIRCISCCIGMASECRGGTWIRASPHTHAVNGPLRTRSSGPS